MPNPLLLHPVLNSSHGAESALPSARAEAALFISGRIRPPMLCLGMSAALSIAMAGCGGRSLDFEKGQIAYEQIPYARSEQAKTFQVKIEADPGCPLQADGIRVQGLTPVADKGDVVILVSTKPGIVDRPELRSETKAQYNAFMQTAEGQRDMTMSRHYEKMGFREAMVADARVLAVHFVTGSVSQPIKVEASDGEGRQLIAVEVGKSSQVAVGSQPSALKYRTDIGNSVSTSEDNVFVDDIPLWSGWQPLRLFEPKKQEIEGKLAAGATTPERDRAKARYAAVANARLDHYRRTAGDDINAFLEKQFGSGSRTFSCDFALFKDDPAFAKIRQRYQDLIGASDKKAAATTVITGLEGQLGLSDLTIRERAAIQYDIALCWLLAEDLVRAKAMADTAEKTNRLEKDGVFSSTGADWAAGLRLLPPMSPTGSRASKSGKWANRQERRS